MFILSAAMIAPAEAAEVITYAVVVGSNQPGPGQQRLQFADRDAARFEGVILELGGAKPDTTIQLSDPSAPALLGAIDLIGQRVADHDALGEDAVFVFYYSGHARAHALNLGNQEISLRELRTHLEAVPATVTIVVLDACQAGAYSQPKGVEPGADFSWNAVAGLDTEGTAVLTSSSAQELSQESAELGGSYFTHHLISGLRGAADSDIDGRVTLTEAYHYAYNRTLVATAATALGSQHVTLETDLRGYGEMILTHPAKASAQLLLAEAFSGDVLIHHAPSQVVAAEVHKAPGNPLRVALIPGQYEAVIRADGEASRCSFTMQNNTFVHLEATDCAAVSLAEVESKGGGSGGGRIERAMVEASLGVLTGGESPYTERLLDFGFEAPMVSPRESVLTGQLALAVSFSQNLAVILGFGGLDTGAFNRAMLGADEELDEHSFTWSAYRLGVYGRLSLPLLRGMLVPYVQGGVGPALAVSRYRKTDLEVVENNWGGHAAFGGGLQIMPRSTGWRHVGGFIQAEGITAVALTNLMGDRHDSGGLTLVTGIRIGG